MSGHRILIVGEGRYSDFSGGAETVIRYLGQQLASRGHEVHTLTRKPQRQLPDYELIHDIHVHRYPGPPINSPFYRLYPIFSFWGALHRFVGLNYEHRFDSIIFNHPFPAIGILSSGLCNGTRKVYVFHSATHLEFRAAIPKVAKIWAAGFSLPVKFVKRVERAAIKRCDAVVTLSRYMRDEVARFHGDAAPTIEVIPGGVDTESFSPVRTSDERTQLREEFGVPNEAFVLFAAKRLYAGMGLENLIDAVGLLAAKEPEMSIRLLLAGNGPLRRDLESHIGGMQLGDLVRVLGNVPYHQMASLQISDYDLCRFF